MHVCILRVFLGVRAEGSRKRERYVNMHSDVCVRMFIRLFT